MADARDVLAETLAEHINICPGNQPDAGCFKDADLLLSALDAAGLAVVPAEPTPSMIDAALAPIRRGMDQYTADLAGETLRMEWRAMLAAAPKS